MYTFMEAETGWYSKHKTCTDNPVQIINQTGQSKLGGLQRLVTAAVNEITFSDNDPSTMMVNEITFSDNDPSTMIVHLFSFHFPLPFKQTVCLMYWICNTRTCNYIYPRGTRLHQSQVYGYKFPTHTDPMVVQYHSSGHDLSIPPTVLPRPTYFVQEWTAQ